jgi:DNA-binding GntR family transcriptional regulator
MAGSALYSGECFRKGRIFMSADKSGLAERAYLGIREKILRGQLPFGASISRREISRELGMSTLPVSEALQRLRTEALVETAPRVGTRVRIPTPQDIRGFYVVREALESQAARLFAEKATPADRQELAVLAERLDGVYQACVGLPGASGQQLYELRDLHMEFHLRVAEGAHCPFLHQAIERNQILIFNWFLDRLFGYPGLPPDWHAQLACVLTSLDPEAADRAMRSHVRFRMDALLERLEPYFRLDRRHLVNAMNGIQSPFEAGAS